MSLYHLPSQIFIACIVILVLIRTFLVARRNKLSKQFTLLWVVLWSSLLIIVFNLGTLSAISASLGIGRGVDLVIYLSIIVLFVLFFHLLINQKKQSRELTKLIRGLALSKFEPKSK